MPANAAAHAYKLNKYVYDFVCAQRGGDGCSLHALLIARGRGFRVINSSSRFPLVRRRIPHPRKATALLSPLSPHRRPRRNRCRRTRHFCPDRRKRHAFRPRIDTRWNRSGQSENFRQKTKCILYCCTAKKQNVYGQYCFVIGIMFHNNHYCVSSSVVSGSILLLFWQKFKSYYTEENKLSRSDFFIFFFLIQLDTLISSVHNQRRPS